MRNLIFKKIMELQVKQPTINKFFTFTIEDLQDDPEGCLEVIEDYLEKHKDKIDDFFFESWIDEETFAPILMLKITPVAELAQHMFASNSLNCLLPSSMESEILRERIQNILVRNTWDFNDETNREMIKKELEFFLFNSKYNLTIIDKTTTDNVDKGILNFIVSIGDSEMTLNEYLDHISAKKRFE